MKLYCTIFTVLLFIMSVHRLSAMQNTLTTQILQQLQVPYTLPTDTACISTVSYSPNGSYIAAGSENGTVHIWNAPTRKLIKTLPHPSCINAISWNSTGTRLALATNCGVCIYDTNTWSMNSFSLYGKCTSVSYYSPNNQELAVSIQSKDHVPLKADNHYVVILDSSTLKVKEEYADPANLPCGTLEEELEKNLNTLHMYWTPNNELTILKSHGQSIKSTKGAHFTLNCSSRPLVACYSPNGKAIAVATEDGKTYIYDINTKTDDYVSKNNKQSNIQALCWNCTSTRIATVTTNEIDIWDIETKTCIYTLKTCDTISSIYWYSENYLVAGAGNALYLWHIKDREAAEYNLRHLTPEQTALLDALDNLYLKDASYGKYKCILKNLDPVFESLNPTLRLALKVLLPPVKQHYKNSLTTGAKTLLALGIIISGYILWKSSNFMAQTLYTPGSAP